MLDQIFHPFGVPALDQESIHRIPILLDKFQSEVLESFCDLMEPTKKEGEGLLSSGPACQLRIIWKMKNVPRPIVLGHFYVR